MMSGGRCGGRGKVACCQSLLLGWGSVTPGFWGGNPVSGGKWQLLGGSLSELWGSLGHMCACTYVHTCAHRHAHVPTRVDTHAHMHVFTHAHVCTHHIVHAHVSSHRCIHILSHTPPRIHTHAHTCHHRHAHARGLTHTHTCPHTCTHVSSRTRVLTHVHTHMSHTHVFSHTCTFTRALTCTHQCPHTHAHMCPHMHTCTHTQVTRWGCPQGCALVILSHRALVTLPARTYLTQLFLDFLPVPPSCVPSLYSRITADCSSITNTC